MHEAPRYRGAHRSSQEVVPVMRTILRGIATLATAAALAACSGGGTATSAPATGASATQAPACIDSTDPTTVEATVADFAWSQPISAKVGDVITWTNSDTAAHRVATDDGSCTMGANIAGSGGKQSLVFNKAGTYAFHCTLHANMTGTITIS
jgi:plastocyanin